MAQQKQDNQTEAEFFAIAATGRDGVEDMLIKMGAEIHKIAAPNVAKVFDVWKARALVEIAGSEAMRDVIKTRAGLYSVYQGLAKAATAGLQIGSHVPQVYFVPKNGRAVMILTKEGYAQIATYGPGAVLREYPALHKVYEKDTFRIDEAARSYDHGYEPFNDRGKLLGFFTVLEYKDGRKTLPHILHTKVRQIQSDYKLSEKSPAWRKSPDEMDEKTAMKWLLREPMRESAGLAMLEESESEYVGPETPAPDMRDVTERVGDRLDEKIEALIAAVEEKPKADAADAAEETEAEKEADAEVEATEDPVGLF